MEKWSTFTIGGRRRFCRRQQRAAMGGKAKLHADDLGLLDDAGVEGEAVYVKDEEGEA